MLTGYTTTTVGGRTQISQGNPDLNQNGAPPSTPALEWTTRGHALNLPCSAPRLRDWVHLERRRQRSAAARAHRPVGSQRTPRAPQRPRSSRLTAGSGRWFAVFDTHALLQSAGNAWPTGRSRTCSMSRRTPSWRRDLDVDAGPISGRLLRAPSSVWRTTTSASPDFPSSTTKT